MSIVHDTATTIKTVTQIQIVHQFTRTQLTALSALLKARYPEMVGRLQSFYDPKTQRLVVKAVCGAAALPESLTLAGLKALAAEVAPTQSHVEPWMLVQEAQRYAHSR